MFDKLLIANRGEIAVRVIRAAKSLGIETVAIYSDQDKSSKHIQLADESVSLGGGPASKNYLNIEKIIEVAQVLNIDSLHPGYGFLSESSEFAHAITEQGITWVGPNSKSIKLLGDKITARDLAEKVGIPTTKGSDKPVQATEEAYEVAEKIGYPVIVKARAGGGGMGMQVAYAKEELLPAIEKSTKQSLAAFGNPEVFIEKYIENPRHIEIQFIADSKGNIVHLGERECSIQRRHQKLVEEATSVAITDEERKQIGGLVKKLAKEVQYVNAGTAEFLYKDGQFYFNEVNTRIQVEHPVTEMITGVDLVQEQLKVAMGNKLSFRQNEIKFNGHAIEMRINAEDPLTNFTPTFGTVRQLSIPGGPGVRFDTHLYSGYTIPRDYDSLLGKLIVWGRTRKESIVRAFHAVSELAIVGIPTNHAFHRVTLANKRFHSGDINTNFITEENIIPYIREAFNRRVAALFANQFMTRKVFLPIREQSNWKTTALAESVKRWS